MFFSDFGSLIHDIFAQYYSGKISKNEALIDYLTRFPMEVHGKSPSESIKVSYFKSGSECLKNIQPISGRILGVEENVSFEINGKPFIGFIDMVYEDQNSNLIIMDHKSRSLKPRSNRKKRTKYDIELDNYLRQLYLYSIATKEKCGRYPDFLEFNCYRTGNRIKEPFHLDALEESKQWALQTIEQINNEKTWKPSLDFWRCKYLCGYSDQCEYAQICTF